MPTRAPHPPAAEPHPGRWRGVAPEDRRSERRTLLMDAAFQLLGTVGWSGTSVRAVCQEARLNPRYFYESFDDLDALVIAVYDRVVEELAAVVLAALDSASPDPAAQLRATLEATVGFVDDDRRRSRVLYVEALGNEALNRRRIDTGHAVATFVQDFAKDRDGPPPEGEPIGAVAASILVGGLSELIVAWIEGRVETSREQLIDDATTLFLALGEAAAAVAANRPPTRRNARSSSGSGRPAPARRTRKATGRR